MAIPPRVRQHKDCLPPLHSLSQMTALKDNPTKLLVFSDLDGTLLDEDDYSFEAAKPALGELYKSGNQIVFNSSKTFDEIRNLCQLIGHAFPFGFENGSAIAIPVDENVFSYRKIIFGTPYAKILEKLHEVRRQLGFNFRGFADMDDIEIASLTGLSVKAAGIARQRQASEPLLWADSKDQFAQFVEVLSGLGLRILKGGRFYHVASPFSKDHVVNWFTHHFQDRYPDTNWVSVGLGDAPNDVAMLQATDHAIMIRSRHHEPPRLDRVNKTTISDKYGPQGWNQTIFDLMQEYEIG